MPEASVSEPTAMVLSFWSDTLGGLAPSLSFGVCGGTGQRQLSLVLAGAETTWDELDGSGWGRSACRSRLKCG